MAQHMPIESFKQAHMQNIAEGIRKEFQKSKGMLKTSMRYEFLSDRHPEFRAHKDDEVFQTSRYIGKGFIRGDTKGIFEVHYNKALKIVENIYLVA